MGDAVPLEKQRNQREETLYLLYSRATQHSARGQPVSLWPAVQFGFMQDSKRGPWVRSFEHGLHNGKASPRRGEHWMMEADGLAGTDEYMVSAFLSPKEVVPGAPGHCGKCWLLSLVGRAWEVLTGSHWPCLGLVLQLNFCIYSHQHERSYLNIYLQPSACAVSIHCGPRGFQSWVALLYSQENDRSQSLLPMYKIYHALGHTQGAWVVSRTLSRLRNSEPRITSPYNSPECVWTASMVVNTDTYLNFPLASCYKILLHWFGTSMPKAQLH